MNARNRKTVSDHLFLTQSIQPLTKKNKYESKGNEIRTYERKKAIAHINNTWKIYKTGEGNNGCARFSQKGTNVLVVGLLVLEEKNLRSSVTPLTATLKDRGVLSPSCLLLGRHRIPFPCRMACMRN